MPPDHPEPETQARGEARTEPVLLAVDLGLRTGLAAFAADGRLLYARSRHLGNRGAMRRAAAGMLADLRELRFLVLEGGGPLADIWLREAARRGLATMTVSAETWRADLLYPRERRSASQAKRAALDLALRLFVSSGLPRPRDLRDDAAEAALCGLWAAWRTGLIAGLPPALARITAGAGNRDRASRRS